LKESVAEGIQVEIHTLYYYTLWYKTIEK